MYAQDFILQSERDILRYSLVQTLTIDDIQSSQVIRNLKEHVAVVGQALEALSIVRELVRFVGSGRIAEEDAGDLVRKVVRELRVICHDIGVGVVCD